KGKPATESATKDPAAQSAPAWAWKLPAGITDAPTVPADNPMTAEKVALGHKLFMDKRLSADGSRSCYSCHQNQHGAADGRKTALGAKGKALSRNSPTIWNVGLHKEFYWDGRAPSLEKQAIGALKGGNMGLGDTLADKAASVGALPEYKEAFAKIFTLDAGAKVDPEHVAKALSAYERTLLCGDTGYDKQELSAAQKRGQTLFMGKAGCMTCHNGANFSDGIYHVTGMGTDLKDEKADVGRFKVSQDEAQKYAFKTPTLRNVTKTGPYFHDGSTESLEDAVRLMASGGNPQNGLTLDPLLLDRKLSDEEVKDITAFLGATACPGELEVIGDQSADGIAPPA
ncbi:MAG: c-type cytochrome, partial [Nannocystaceae bacterium]|nr:c-type cytochrome [Nannocystaceae bacterium]